MTAGETQPQDGDYFVVSVSGDVGTLIRFGQWINGSGFANFEHAGVYVGDGVIVEAEPSGAKLSPASRYDGRTIAWSTGHFPLTDQQREKIVAAARGYVGIGYSFADYGALAAHRLHLPVPGLRGYIAASGHMICSQLVDQCYQDAGVHLFQDGRWPGYVTPGDLWNLIH